MTAGGQFGWSSDGRGDNDGELAPCRGLAMSLGTPAESATDSAAKRLGHWLQRLVATGSGRLRRARGTPSSLLLATHWWWPSRLGRGK